MKTILRRTEWTALLALHISTLSAHTDTHSHTHIISLHLPHSDIGSHHVCVCLKHTGNSGIIELILTQLDVYVMLWLIDIEIMTSSAVI